MSVKTSGTCKEESEPTEDMSKRLLVVKSINSLQLIRQAVAVICLPATEQPALRRQELYTGFYTKREKLPLRCAKSLTGVWKNPNHQKAVIQGILKEANA